LLKQEIGNTIAYETTSIIKQNKYKPIGRS